MQRLASLMLTALIISALLVTVFVVAVGGVVCVRDDKYEFSEYLNDLEGTSKLFAAAIIGCIAQAFLPKLTRNGNGPPR